MAKGMFTVFSDAPPASTTSSRPPAPRHRIAKHCSGGGRPFDGGKAGLGPATTSSNGGKENVDPFAPRVTLGKPHKVALGSKSLASAPSSCAAPPGKTKQPFVQPSDNGVCTGTLRTRVAPTFDESPAAPALAPSHKATKQPQPSRSTLSASSSFAIPPASTHSAPAAIVEILPSPVASMRSRLSVEDSPSSARDSGYAHSSGAVSEDEGCGSEDDVKVQQVAWRNEDERTVKLGAVPRRRGGERKSAEEGSDRRARALTESPLAEVTQAYTGLGNFSLPTPASPSPLASSSFPISSAESFVPLSGAIATKRPAVTRTRSSPTKTAPVARTKPYSTTQTTRKAKPAPTSSAPLLPRSSSGDGLTKGVRSMRV